MREHYGEQLGQATSDPDWIALTAERGWIAFNKDDAIRRNDLERRAVLRHGARLFCVPRADITAEQLAVRYLTNLAAITRVAQERGPYIYCVYPPRSKQCHLSSQWHCRAPEAHQAAACTGDAVNIGLHP